MRVLVPCVVLSTTQQCESENEYDTCTRDAWAFWTKLIWSRELGDCKQCGATFAVCNDVCHAPKGSNSLVCCYLFHSFSSSSRLR